MLDGGKDKYARQIIELLHAEIFDFKRIRKTIHHVSACTRYLRNRKIDYLERDRFRKSTVCIEGATATGVSNVYKKNVVEMPTNQIKMCEYAAHFTLLTHLIEPFNHPMKTAKFSVLDSSAR